MASRQILALLSESSMNADEWSWRAWIDGQPALEIRQPPPPSVELDR